MVRHFAPKHYIAGRYCLDETLVLNSKRQLTRVWYCCLWCGCHCAGARAASGEAQVSSLVSQLDDTNSRLDATAARLSTLELTLESTAADARQQLQEQQQAVAAATALAAAAAERSSAAEAAAAAATAAGGSDGSVRAVSTSGGANAQQALITESLTKQLAELKLQFGELAATVTSMSRASCVAAAFQRRHSKADSHSVKSDDLQGGQAGAAVEGKFSQVPAAVLKTCLFA